MANTIPANNNTGLYNTANATPPSIGNTTYVNNLQASGNILANGYISATGNITTAGYFVGNFAGNVTGNLTVPGSNTQVIYNNNGNAGAAADTGNSCHGRGHVGGGNSRHCASLPS
jgi:H+/gluconate symporter-like permease